MNVSGPNTVPRGTPDFTGASSELSPSTTTLCTRFVNHWVIHSSVLPLIPLYSSFPISRWCATVSKALEKSSTRRSSWSRSFKHLVRSSTVLTSLVLAAMQCPKAVLEMHQDFVYVHMVHDAFEHNVLEHFAAHTCEWYGSVISYNTSLAFFEDRSNVGFLPILRDLSWIEGLLEGHSEDRSYVISKVFQQSCWYQVWAYGLSGIQLLEQCFDPIDRDPDARHWWIWAGDHTGHVVTIFINENTWILIVQDLCLTFAGCL